MQHIVTDAVQSLPRALYDVLPARLLEEIIARTPTGTAIEEVRLRRDRVASLTVRGQNLTLSTRVCGKEMEEILLRVCGGSLYAHEETLCRGYVAMGDGIRVGLCGEAGVVGGKVIGVSSITSLVFRLPHTAPPMLGEEICGLLREMQFTRGVLLYAPPGVGKTTLLRTVAARMAGGDAPVRVAVVDTRGELSFGLRAPSLLLDILSGYPRGLGVSIATRTLSAELIVTDEIGDLEEARELLAAQSAGVALLASAHAATLDQLLSRPTVRLLHDAALFGAYVGLSRRPEAFDFAYNITRVEDVNLGD